MKFPRWSSTAPICAARGRRRRAAPSDGSSVARISSKRCKIFGRSAVVGPCQRWRRRHRRDGTPRGVAGGTLAREWRSGRERWADPRRRRRADGARHARPGARRRGLRRRRRGRRRRRARPRPRRAARRDPARSDDAGHERPAVPAGAARRARVRERAGADHDRGPRPQRQPRDRSARARSSRSRSTSTTCSTRSRSRSIARATPIAPSHRADPAGRRSSRRRSRPIAASCSSSSTIARGCSSSTCCCRERGYTVVSMTRALVQLSRLARALRPRAILLELDERGRQRRAARAARREGARPIPILVFARDEAAAGSAPPDLLERAADADLLSFVERQN